MPLDWKVQNFKAVNILQINAIQTISKGYYKKLE